MTPRVRFDGNSFCLPAAARDLLGVPEALWGKFDNEAGTVTLFAVERKGPVIGKLYCGCGWLVRNNRGACSFGQHAIRHFLNVPQGAKTYVPTELDHERKVVVLTRLPNVSGAGNRS